MEGVLEARNGDLGGGVKGMSGRSTADGRGFGRGHFADGRRQAVVSDGRFRRLRGRVRQNRLHDALIFWTGGTSDTSP